MEDRMPKAFEECVKRGGRVRTIKPRPDVYIRVCYPKGGGRPIAGEVHHLNGLGATGKPRRGRPKTEEERRRTHRLLHGTDKVPPRGSALAKVLRNFKN